MNGMEGYFIAISMMMLSCILSFFTSVVRRTWLRRQFWLQTAPELVKNIMQNNQRCSHFCEGCVILGFVARLLAQLLMFIKPLSSTSFNSREMIYVLDSCCCTCYLVCASMTIQWYISKIVLRITLAYLMSVFCLLFCLLYVTSIQSIFDALSVLLNLYYDLIWQDVWLKKCQLLLDVVFAKI